MIRPKIVCRQRKAKVPKIATVAIACVNRSVIERCREIASRPSRNVFRSSLNRSRNRGPRWNRRISLAWLASVIIQW